MAREVNVTSIYGEDEILSLLQTPLGRIALPLLFAFNPALFLLAANVAPIAGNEVPLASRAIIGKKGVEAHLLCRNLKASASRSAAQVARS